MATSSASAVWADEPFALIRMPPKRTSNDQHFAVHCANEMAIVHNCIFRSLNAIIQQGSFVDRMPESDIKDFLFYINTWTRMVEYHHHTEESIMFPMINELAGSDVMEVSHNQHEAFHDGMSRLQEYSAKTSASDFKWQDAKAIIDSFAEPFATHMRDEIDVMKGLETYDSKELQRIWAETEKVAVNSGGTAVLYDVFPLVMGCNDRTYDGGNDFPPLPTWMFYAITWWFAGYNKGSWRFSPCDMNGQPQPLKMRPVEN